jgi:hypothetical protein
LPTTVRPASDTRAYRIIRLSNGLKACLVSDPDDGADDDSDADDDGRGHGHGHGYSASEAETDEEAPEGCATDAEDEDGEEDNGREEPAAEKVAAVALCCGAGSFEDLPELQGIAHFVEHMLFMGSEKCESHFS